MSTGPVPATEESYLEDETNDAASALTYLRGLSDINEAADYPKALKYLKRVQASAGGDQYLSFIGVLREFQEEVVRDINEKKDYVTKCALTLLRGHTDLLVGLADYIPEMLTALEPDEKLPDQERHERPSIASGWERLQADASLHSEHIQFQQAREAFLAKVQKRFLHSDHTSCVKIHAILEALLVDMAMDVTTAKEKMAPLLQRHNDLWKEFESFLPPPLRSGPSSSKPYELNPCNTQENLAFLSAAQASMLPPRPPRRLPEG